MHPRQRLQQIIIRAARCSLAFAINVGTKERTRSRSYANPRCYACVIQTVDQAYNEWVARYKGTVVPIGSGP